MSGDSRHNFSEEELRAVVRAATGDWSGATLEQHVREVCKDLQRVIRHTHVAAFVVREVSAVPLVAEGYDPSALLDYATHYNKFDPMGRAFGDPDRPVGTLDGAAAQQGVDLKRNPFVQEFLLGKLGVRRILGTNIIIAPRVTLALSFHRAKGLDEFGDKETVAVNVALPGMGRGFATTFARERSLEIVRRQERTDESSGVALYTEELELVDASASARALLLSLEEAGGLHDVLLVGRRLVSKLKKHGKRSFVDCSLTKGDGEGLVSVRVMAIRAGRSDEIRVEVLLDRILSKLELLVARMSEQYHLTRREIEVLSLLLEGVTQGGIATRLGIARTGVRDHLVSIRRKLDVKTNEQLLARLMGLA